MFCGARPTLWSGDCIPFVDPALPAPDAPLSWLMCAAAPILEAMADWPEDPSGANVRLADLASADHVIISPDRTEDVILRDSKRALTLRLRGARASMGPVAVNFLVCATPHAAQTAPIIASASKLLFRPEHAPDHSHQRRLLREALIALDAQCMRASYREAATLIFGAERTAAAWSSGSTWLKERMRRALAKGRALRDGGYQKLLAGGCRSDH